MARLNLESSIPDPSTQIKDQYVNFLSNLEMDILKLKSAIEKKRPVAELRTYFKASRLTYKRMAWTIEFFNPYESRLVNGPALKRTEEDNPQTIIEPQGFQVIEETLFGDWEADSRSRALEQVNQLHKTIQRLINEPDLQYKFRDEVIFGALRSSLIRLAAMGISGFDSPVAEYSLPEAMATLDGIAHAVHFYKGNKSAAAVAEIYKLNLQILNAKKLLATKKSGQLDRLAFLKDHLDPIFATLITIKEKLGIEMLSGRLPTSQQSKSLFDPKFFNPDFFSPNERFRMSAERIALGKKLFFDPILSGTGNRSCGSCHKPELAFTDGVATPLAIDETPLLRNTPTLWNSVFQTRQFFDSRTATLENQLSDVVHNSREMKGSLKDVIPQLQVNHYAPLFREAYKNEQEKITAYNIANAIASYIRSLIGLNSRFDQYMRGNTKAMNASEKNGFNVFLGKAKCGTCHYLPLFNGLIPPDFNETESEVLGVPQTTDTINAKLDADEGKFNFTRSLVQKFSFKTPTLRNIELTAPYMHNGVYKTLDEVIDFYNKGGGAGLNIAPENQTLPPDKLNLTIKEKKDIIAFLKTLTDTTYHSK